MSVRSDRFATVITRRHDLLVVLATALTFRATFALLVADTYDYDEFVYLLLGRDFSHGSVPYRDFMFFTPPGILVVLRPLEPLLNLWWPSGRVLSLLADTATAGLVWQLAHELHERKVALVAGVLYAISPLALISAVRVGPDPLITLLGTAGLALLVCNSSLWAAGVSGLCLGAAVWIKFPALYFLPVYLLAAPRRSLVYGPVAFLAAASGFLPFHGEWSQLYAQAVTFQRTRWPMTVHLRVVTLVLYWLGVNALAPIALVRTRPPMWLAAGFILGGTFALSSQVYYHYFVPVVPFAAILAAPMAVSLLKRPMQVIVLAGSLVLACWAITIDLGGASPFYVTSAHFSSIHSTIVALDHSTGVKEPVLGDRYEYAYLARRPALAHYFWNVGVEVNARYLERRLDGAGAAVLSYGASSGYPASFTDYLDRRYKKVKLPANTLWLFKPAGR